MKTLLQTFLLLLIASAQCGCATPWSRARLEREAVAFLEENDIRYRKVSVDFRKRWHLHLYRTTCDPLPRLSGKPLRELHLTRSPVTNLAPLVGMPLRKLVLYHTFVTNLQPLAGLPLRELTVWHTPVTDISPLKDVSLRYLSIGEAHVSDISPIRDKHSLRDLGLWRCAKITNLPPLQCPRLKVLNIHGNRLHDLSPVSGLPLAELTIQKTQISDLSPIRGMRLRKLFIHDTLVSDLSPLEGMPLEWISLSVERITSGIEVLRRMKTLERITYRVYAPGKYSTTVCPEKFWALFDAGTFLEGMGAEQADGEATSKPAPVPGVASEASHP